VFDSSKGLEINRLVLSRHTNSQRNGLWAGKIVCGHGAREYDIPRFAAAAIEMTANPSSRIRLNFRNAYI
jgi:hypothetical protein